MRCDAMRIYLMLPRSDLEPTAARFAARCCTDYILWYVYSSRVACGQLEMGIEGGKEKNKK